MITIPAIGPLKLQFRRLPAGGAMFFLVIGAVMIAAAVIVRANVGEFPFQSGGFFV